MRSCAAIRTTDTTTTLREDHQPLPKQPLLVLMNFVNPRKMILVSVLSLLFGGYMFYTWLPIFADRHHPIVTGTVTQRTPIQQGGIPRVDFTIEIADPPATVHAHAQRYLIDEVPNEVSFRYSGDPDREVFLMDHEENPLWIALFCLGVGLFLGVFGILIRQSPNNRRVANHHQEPGNTD